MRKISGTLLSGTDGMHAHMLAFCAHLCTFKRALILQRSPAQREYYLQRPVNNYYRKYMCAMLFIERLAGGTHHLRFTTSWQICYIQRTDRAAECTRSVIFKAGPPEAILVIFGRRSLLCFVLFESSLKNMKNDITFMCMRSVWSLWKFKDVKKRHSLRQI